MKSNSVLAVIALLSLILAVFSSTLIWGDVGSAVKFGMFAFGFGSGVAVGARAAKRNPQQMLE